MTIRTSSTNFAWLCEISNSTVAVTVFWSISHDYVKFLHDHAKWKYLIFNISFLIYSISSFWIHLNYLQINSKSWSKCIDFSSSSTLFFFLNSISFLSLNASKITLKYFQNFTKIISISYKYPINTLYGFWVSVFFLHSPYIHGSSWEA